MVYLGHSGKLQILSCVQAQYCHRAAISVSLVMSRIWASASIRPGHGRLPCPHPPWALPPRSLALPPGQILARPGCPGERLPLWQNLQALNSPNETRAVVLATSCPRGPQRSSSLLSLLCAPDADEHVSDSSLCLLAPNRELFPSFCRHRGVSPMGKALFQGWRHSRGKTGQLSVRTALTFQGIS